VYTQQTDIVQREGTRLTYEKAMRTGLRIGDGLPISVCEIEEVSPALDDIGPWVSARLEPWRSAAFGAWR
jgi:hypothetical protein